MEPSSASEWLDSQEDTLTESMLSPELPLAVDLGCSLLGVLLVIRSDPRNSLQKTQCQALSSYKSGICDQASIFVLNLWCFLHLVCSVLTISGKHLLQGF